MILTMLDAIHTRSDVSFHLLPKGPKVSVPPPTGCYGFYSKVDFVLSMLEKHKRLGGRGMINTPF